MSSPFLDHTVKYPLLLLLLLRRERRWRIQQAVRRLLWAVAFTWLLTSSLMPELPGIEVQSPEPIFDQFGWHVPVLHGDMPLGIYTMDLEHALHVQAIFTQYMITGRRFH